MLFLLLMSNSRYFVDTGDRELGSDLGLSCAGDSSHMAHTCYL